MSNELLPAGASLEPSLSTKLELSRRTLLQASMSIGAAALAAPALASPAESGSTVSGGDAIRPLKVPSTSRSALVDLRRRIDAVRWPSAELVSDASQGVKLKTMQRLATYWSKGYDWRRCEARIQALPHFMTAIDGVDIHFIHVRSQHANALPLIVTHGWPGSFIEQMKIIEPLTNPLAHGGKADDAFDVIIPSIPGYGYSAAPTTTGWDPVRIAKAWIELMRRLGYSKYVAQGGDWGDAITEQMALIAPSALLGIHVNMPATVPAPIAKILKDGGAAPTSLTPDERNAFDQLDTFFKKGLGYAIEMANRPQSLYALEDSPIGLAAWILDHDARSMELISRVFDGAKEGLTRDDVLDNITLYWLTKTAVSSARLYWENQLPFFDVKGLRIPVAVSVFPDEIYAAPRSWTEQAYPRLIHFNRLDKGGHFAAWEQTGAFVQELRTGFRSLRR
jgi:pimeloyl-ACP methyl ester carboxylesterase